MKSFPPFYRLKPTLNPNPTANPSWWQGTYRITALFLIAILPLFAVLFFLLMLPHKLDKTVDWPWFTVFLPIYYFPLRDFIQAGHAT